MHLGSPLRKLCVLLRLCGEKNFGITGIYKLHGFCSPLSR
jgi:hypothetical protein